MSNGVHGSHSQAAPWARLRAWIDEKEAWERQHHSPAPLSSKELAAVANLVSFVPEPDVSGKDYVSALLRYLQGRKLDRPTFTDEGPVEITVNGLKENRWRCFCSMSFVEGHFPREGQGFQEGDEAPAFGNKKNAKQFAAQQALEYLERRSSSPRKDYPPQPSPLTPQPKKLKAETMSPSRPSLGQSTKSQNGGGSNGDAPTIFECVSRLASRMGLDQPSYNIEPEDLPNLYRGRAQFKLGTRAPDDLGLVKGVLGKNNAKVQVAEKVLVWLQMEMQARQASLQSVMSRANRENQ